MHISNIKSIFVTAKKKKMMMEHKTTMYALKLYAKTKALRKEYFLDVPAISFENLGVAFQDVNMMDLRNSGICELSSDKQGNLGVRMRKEYADLDIMEFQNALKEI